MTAFDQTFGDQLQVEQKTSGLAISSLVCSLILCCPLTTLIGPLLGLVAIFTIGSNPARKGKGIAIAGIIIGIIATSVWGSSIVWFQNNINKPINEGPIAVMTAGFAGDKQAFRMGLMGDAAIGTDEEIQEFIDGLHDRYGKFISSEMDIIELSSNPPTIEEMMEIVKVYPYVLQFENATVKARIEFSTNDPLTGKFLWGTKFGRILILDENLGDISYPSKAEYTGETPSESDAVDEPDESDSPDESETTDESGSGE